MFDRTIVKKGQPINRMVSMGWSQVLNGVSQHNDKETHLGLFECIWEFMLDYTRWVTVLNWDRLFIAVLRISAVKKVPLIVSYGQGIVKSDQTTALSIRRDVTTYAGKSFAVTIQETTHCHLPTA